MNQNDLQVSTRTDGQRTILDLVGEVNASASEVLTGAYAHAMESVGDPVVLNFSEVTYINSTGIAVIVELLARARQAHRELVVYGLSDHYLEIFRITRLADYMTIHQDERSALAGE